MPMKKYKPEQIVTLLRQIEVEIATKACESIMVRTLLGLSLLQAIWIGGCANPALFDLSHFCRRKV